MKHWGIFQRYQSVHAYGTGHSGDSPASASIRELAGAFLGQREGLFLGIGCGGLPEAAWLRDHMTEPDALWLLTNHEPESLALIDAGYMVAPGDMHDMPFANDMGFRTIFSNNVLEHAVAHYIALMEARRVAANGALGYFVIPSFGGGEGGRGPFHIACLTVEHWTEDMAKCGWRVDERVDQNGRIADIDFYHHFRCTAVEPKDQSAQVFRELLETHQ